jgi:hypothetical protein
VGFLAIMVLALGLRLMRLGQLPLIADEAFYWLSAQRLDWSYWDHPTGTALMIRLSTVLGGQGAWGIRWLNALVGGGCVALAYALGKRLFSARVGLLAAGLLAVGAPYVVTSRLVYTDALHLSLMLLNLLCLTYMTDLSGQEPCSAPPAWASVAWGATLALLFNTKYSAYLYALGLGLAMLWSHRGLLREKRFWGALALGAAGLLPVLLWNASHAWGSLGWQLTHLVSESPGASLGASPWWTWARNLRHAWVYVTPPVALAALVGLTLPKRTAQRLLMLPAAAMLLPVLLSPANSPRNLTTGMALLILLAADRVILWADSLAQRRWLGAALIGLGCCASALYGLGTVAALHGCFDLPQSSLVPHVRTEMAVSRTLALVAPRYPAPFYTIDYSLAAKVIYATGQPAYTSWGQYRIWGLSAPSDVTVLSLDYVHDVLITDRLRDAFERVTGPEIISLETPGVSRQLYAWRVEGLRWEQERLLRELDFLTLQEVQRGGR